MTSEAFGGYDPGGLAAMTAAQSAHCSAAKYSRHIRRAIVAANKIARAESAKSNEIASGGRLNAKGRAMNASDVMVRKVVTIGPDDDVAGGRAPARRS